MVAADPAGAEVTMRSSSMVAVRGREPTAPASATFLCNVIVWIRLCTAMRLVAGGIVPADWRDGWLADAPTAIALGTYLDRLASDPKIKVLLRNDDATFAALTSFAIFARGSGGFVAPPVQPPPQ